MTLTQGDTWVFVSRTPRDGSYNDGSNRLRYQCLLEPVWALFTFTYLRKQCFAERPGGGL